MTTVTHQLDIDYSIPDNVSGGRVEIYISDTAGQLGDLVETRDPSDPTQTEVGVLAEATDWYVTVRRVTDNTTADSTQVLQATPPFPPTDGDATTTDLAAATVSPTWTDASAGESGYEIRVTEGGTERVLSDEPAGTTSATVGPVDVTATQLTIYAYFTDADGTDVYSAGETATIAFDLRENYWARYNPSDGSPKILDRIVNTGPTYEHTAHHGLDLATRMTPGVDLYATSDPFPDLEVFLDGTRLLDGTIVVRTETDRGLFRLRALGPTWALTRSSPSSPVTYSDISLADALEDYYTTHAASEIESHTVTQPTPVVRASADLLQDASVEAEFQDLTDSVSATDPVQVSSATGNLEQTQTAWTGDAQGFSHSGTTQTVIGATDDTVVRLAGVGQTHTQGSQDFDHDVPISDFEWWIRFEGGTSNIEVTASIDGTAYSQSTFGGSASSLTWKQLPSTEGFASDLTAGSHDFEIEITGSVDSGDKLDLDVVAPLDSGDRFGGGGFDYEFPDTLNSLAYLDGPAWYPTHAQTIDTATNVWNVAEVDITSVWTDTSGGQALGASLDGTTFLTDSNTQTATFDFSATSQVGVTVTPRVTFSGYESSGARLQTPSLGYTPQAISDWELRIDGDDLAVIDSLTLSKTHWENLRTLHDQGDWVMATDPRERGIVVESFRRGDVTKTLDVTIKQNGVTRELDTRGFANEVTVTGKVPDGGSIADDVTVSDATSVAAVGTEAVDILDLQAVTEAEVTNSARQELANRLARDEETGTITITPSVVLPGYSYSNTPWGTTVTLTRVDYREGPDDAEGLLDFTRDTDMTATQIETEDDLEQTKEALNR